MNKIYCKTNKMGDILTAVLLRKRPGFAARKSFIPTVQQQGCRLLKLQAQHPPGSERCHSPPALGVSFNLNLSVSLAHLVKIDVARRLLWCTLGCSPPL